MSLIRSFLIAFSTYSRIPVPQVEWTEENRKYAMCFFPLVGAVLGLILWGWLALCDAAGFGLMVRGAVAALLPLAVTGGIHMDGYMDTLDVLMHKREIIKLNARVMQDGLALIPLSLYFSNGRVKMELGLCKGKKLHDKRDAAAERDAQRDIARAMRNDY